jgi:hypothetical protein
VRWCEVASSGAGREPGADGFVRLTEGGLASAAGYIGAKLSTSWPVGVDTDAALRVDRRIQFRVHHGVRRASLLQDGGPIQCCTCEAVGWRARRW